MPAPAAGLTSVSPERDIGTRLPALPRPALAGLAAFGATGLLLAAILLVGLLQLAGSAGSLVQEQQAIGRLTDSGRATALDGRAAADRAQAGVVATADAADQAATFVTQLASALRETAASLRVDIFGTRPFAAAADRVEQAAGQADQTAAGLTAAANHAREGAAQLQSVTADLDRIATNMSDIGTGLGGGTTVNGLSLTVLTLALIGLVIWLGIPAAVCLWFGLTSWRHRPQVQPTPGRRPVVR
jgi:hypothetical protein